MFKPNKISIALAMALGFTAGQANAEIEVSGYVKNETAWVIDNDQFIGEERAQYDNDSHHGDTLKFENSARIFMNGEFGEESSWHVDLNVIYDSEGVESEYKGHESYTQNDWLREAYIDTKWGDADVRIGKQQVVWGTADGIKLLDIINPTDFREYSQNVMEDSRIPIWMVNVDVPVGETGSLQFILSEHEENKIPGLDEDGDYGHPFTVKGVDTITGGVNGFMNIAPALASVATTFSMAAEGGGFASATGYGGFGGQGLTFPAFGAFSVDTFANSTWNNIGAPFDIVPNTIGGAQGAGSDAVQNITGTGDNGFVLLNALAQIGIGGFFGAPDPYANNSVTNLLNENGTAAWNFLAPSTSTVSWTSQDANSAFEYMSNATFATFNTFAGNLWAGGTHGPVTTTYVRDYPDDDEGNFGFRYRNYLDNGLNYSLNYFYNYDPNPVVDISWHDAVTGAELTTELYNGFGPVSRNAVSNTFDGTTVFLTNRATGNYYGAFNPGLGGFSPNGVELRFTESLNRTHNFGGSFDYAVDSFDVPIVLRGEFLYKKDEMHPVIDKRLLAIGDLEGALSPEEHDMFKYVIGVDVTVATNLLISTQFIQFRNLDYQDDNRTCRTDNAFLGYTGVAFDCSRYTGDAPTLSLSNGLQEAEENKEFISLFFSKPFGAEQQGRWNNITIFEDTGGYWNRFDVEYGFTDELVGSVELNTYWGDDDSWFGQMDDTSNIQVGIKYIFD